MPITFLLILHGIFSVFLMGAVTHQFLGVFWPRKPGQSDFVARARGITVVAFSTDSSVAGRGVFLLSFLPESDVNRIIGYASSIGKRSYAALVPDNAYGAVVEAAFKQQAAEREAALMMQIEQMKAQIEAMKVQAKAETASHFRTFIKTFEFLKYGLSLSIGNSDSCINNADCHIISTATASDKDTTLWRIFDRV